MFTWDILFLIPVPWVGPMLAPMLVSVAMIAAGVWHLRGPVGIGVAHWSGIMTGAVIIVVSCAMDYQNIMAGGIPHSFNWWVFNTGLGVGVLSYASAARGRARQGQAAVEESRDATTRQRRANRSP